jgi:anti-sigma regulatory factor (Ser/Thr protein kinase)
MRNLLAELAGSAAEFHSRIAEELAYPDLSNIPEWRNYFIPGRAGCDFLADAGAEKGVLAMIPGNAGQPGLRAMRAGQGTRSLRDPACRASPGKPVDSADGPTRDPAGPAGAGSAAAAGSRDDPSAARARLRIPPFITRQGRGTDDRWPLQNFLELGAVLSAVPCARLHATQVLREWGIECLADSAGLLVTELVANAVTASRGMAQVSGVRLWLLSDSAQILILVWDASPQPPVLADVTSEAEQGRGLRIVEAVSEQWGWYASGNGKIRLGDREVMHFRREPSPWR